MTGEYNESINKSVKLHPPDREALDEVVEESEWGNASAAIRGLIRQAASDTVSPDGGPQRDTRGHHPDTDRLNAIYRAALRLVDHSHVLHDDDCGTVARLVTNDSSNPWTPQQDAVRRCLRRLQPEYVYVSHQSTSIRHTRDDAGRTIYRIKPEGAVPSEWKWHRDNVRDRKRARRERRFERIVSRS